MVCAYYPVLLIGMRAYADGTQGPLKYCYRFIIASRSRFTIGVCSFLVPVVYRLRPSVAYSLSVRSFPFSYIFSSRLVVSYVSYTFVRSRWSSSFNFCLRFGHIYAPLIFYS